MPQSAEIHNWQAHALASSGCSGPTQPARGRDEDGFGTGERLVYLPACALSLTNLLLNLFDKHCLETNKPHLWLKRAILGAVQLGIILGAVTSDIPEASLYYCWLCPWQIICHFKLTDTIVLFCLSCRQVGKVLGNDPSGRAAFVHSGGLAAVQQMAEAPGSKLKEAVEIINSAYPEEVGDAPN